MNNEHIFEDNIIDYLNGNLDEKGKQTVETHIEECEQCNRLYNFWQDTLPADSNMTPSPLLKKRIDKQLKRERIRKHPIPKPTAIAGLVIIVVIFLSLPNILRQSTTTEPDYEIFQNNEISDRELFVNSPEVEKQDIVPIADDDLAGKVWVNNETQEVLLEVYGLAGLDKRDYQLWIVDRHNRAKGELLMVENGSTRVLYRLDDLSHYKFLKASVEPLGGSQQPTGPETFFVNFE
ncbi:anti-sigma factor domain-containing protein [Gracilibacillus xinjiangensis]|uniref:Anti-sigma factor domain-containing protein n=1 Tax=Gracilibacillus xinjiangensis TaxID=1193282 RepID=A0ABV8WP19_9BACI